MFHLVNFKRKLCTNKALTNATGQMDVARIYKRGIGALRRCEISCYGLFNKTNYSGAVIPAANKIVRAAF